jgi:hypothetical protein
MLGFARDGDAHVLDVTRRDFTGRGLRLEIDVPAPRGPQAYTQCSTAAPIFHAEIPVASATAARRSRAASRWSGTARDRGGRARPRSRVRAARRIFREGARRDVRLVRIRDFAEARAVVQRPCAATGQALRARWTTTIYDGATVLGHSFPTLRPARSCCSP